MAEETQPNIDLSQSEIRSLASLFYPHIVDYYDTKQAVAFEMACDKSLSTKASH